MYIVKGTLEVDSYFSAAVERSGRSDIWISPKINEKLQFVSKFFEFFLICNERSAFLNIFENLRIFCENWATSNEN